MLDIRFNKNTILYMILFTGVFSDLLRLPGSVVTVYRLLMLIGFIIAGGLGYKLTFWALILLGFNVFQCVVFTSFFSIVPFDIRIVLEYEYFYLCIGITLIIVYGIYVNQRNCFFEKFKQFIYFFSIINIVIFIVLAANDVYRNGRSVITNVNDYGASLAAFFPIVFVDAVEKKKKANFVIAALIIALEYLNDCKLCFLGIIVELFVILFLYGKSLYSQSGIVIVVSCTLLFCLVIFAGLTIVINGDFFGAPIVTMIFEPIDHILHLELYPRTDSSAPYRVNVFIMGIIWIFKTCFIGMGAGSAGVLTKNYLTENTEFSTTFPILSPHNAWLEFLLDFGFIAVIIYFVVLRYGIKGLLTFSYRKYYLPSVVCALTLWIWVLAPSGIYTNYGLIILLFYYYLKAVDYRNSRIVLE